MSFMKKQCWKGKITQCWKEKWEEIIKEVAVPEPRRQNDKKSKIHFMSKGMLDFKENRYGRFSD